MNRRNILRMLGIGAMAAPAVALSAKAAATSNIDWPKGDAPSDWNDDIRARLAAMPSHTHTITDPGHTHSITVQDETEWLRAELQNRLESYQRLLSHMESGKLTIVG